MLGASKLTEKDVVKIKDLIENSSLTLQQIADMFGVSRPHISSIKLGSRWNEEKNSFIMKEDLKKLTRTITLLGGKSYSTGITPLYTINGKRYVFIHYVDDVEVKVDYLVMPEPPPYEVLVERHRNFTQSYSKNC